MALAAAIVRGTVALPAIQKDGRGGAKSGGGAASIDNTGSEPATRAQAQISSGQHTRGDELRDQSVLLQKPDTLSNSISAGVDGRDGLVTDTHQHGAWTGSDHMAAAGAGGTVGASARERASGEGPFAALVQGGPEEDPEQAGSVQGSITEVLTPGQNAALLKVRHRYTHTNALVPASDWTCLQPS